MTQYKGDRPVPPDGLYQQVNRSPQGLPYPQSPYAQGSSYPQNPTYQQQPSYQQQWSYQQVPPEPSVSPGWDPHAFGGMPWSGQPTSGQPAYGQPMPGRPTYCQPAPQASAQPAEKPPVRGGIRWVFLSFLPMGVYIGLQFVCALVGSLILLFMGSAAGGISQDEFLNWCVTASQLLAILIGIPWYRSLRRDAAHRWVLFERKAKASGQTTPIQQTNAQTGQTAQTGYCVQPGQTVSPGQISPYAGNPYGGNPYSAPYLTSPTPAPVQKTQRFVLLDQLIPRPKRPASVGKLLLDILLILVIGVIAQTATDAMLTLIEPLIPDTMAQYNEMMKDLSDTSVISVLSLAILAPIAEEIFFRGITLEMARRITPKAWVAIVLQAAIFGLAHGNPIQSTYTFLLGLVLGVIALYVGGLPATMLLHFSVNSSSYAASELLSWADGLGTAGYWFALVGSLAVGALCLVILLKTHGVKIPLSRAHDGRK